GLQSIQKLPGPVRKVGQVVQRRAQHDEQRHQCQDGEHEPLQDGSQPAELLQYFGDGVRRRRRSVVAWLTRLRAAGLFLLVGSLAAGGSVVLAVPTVFPFCLLRLGLLVSRPVFALGVRFVPGTRVAPRRIWPAGPAFLRARLIALIAATRFVAGTL